MRSIGASAVGRLTELRTRAAAQPRLVLAAFLVLSVGAGAAIGAGMHPARPQFRAEAELSVRAAPAEPQQVAWRTLAQALDIGRVRRQIAEAGSEQASEVRVGADGDPRSALMTIHAIGASGQQAQLLANGAAAAAIAFMQQTDRPAAAIRSSFEGSTEGWDLGGGLFVLPPGQARVTASDPHAGRGALEVTCTTSVVGGCGPYLRLARAVLHGADYEARGWIRASSRMRVRLVLGSRPDDVAVGETVTAGPRWRRLAVTWRPQHDADAAVSTFQVMSRGTSRFAIDDVVVGRRSAIARGAGAAEAGPSYATVLPATSASSVQPQNTGAWAGGGAAAGLLVAASAAAAFAGARRARDRQAHSGVT